MWRELLLDLDASCRFTPAASRSALADARNKLGCRLPKELADLWRETDGVEDRYANYVVAPVEIATAWNVDFRTRRRFRTLYMPFDHLLFFGAIGNGNLAAYRVLNGLVRDRDVYVWDHENDSRMWVAPNLERFFESYLDGRLED